MSSSTSQGIPPLRHMASYWPLLSKDVYWNCWRGKVVNKWNQCRIRAIVILERVNFKWMETDLIVPVLFNISTAQEISDDKNQYGLVCRPSKCLNNHNQRLCKISLAGVNLLLQKNGVL